MQRIVKRVALLTIVASLLAVAGTFGAATASAQRPVQAYCGGYTGADGDWHIKCYIL